MNYIDLHVHSTYSDGTCTPKELIELAAERGLTYIALTDHDTTEGIPYALAAAKHSSVRVIPGVELSSDYTIIRKEVSNQDLLEKQLVKDIHIVGLGIDYKNPAFAEHLQKFQQERTERNVKMCRNLEEAGFDISYEALHKAFPDAILTRCHIARFLLDKGYVRNIDEAFERYIGSHCPCYVPRTKITPMKAVSLIKSAGGTAVLAHPMLYHLTEKELCELIEQLKQFGLDGIEAIYSRNLDGEEPFVRSLAEKYALAISGGSDFHGTNKPDIELGTGKGNNIRVPEELLKGLHLSRLTLFPPV